MLLNAWLGKGVMLRQLYGLTGEGSNTAIMPAAEAVDHPELCGRGGISTKHRVVQPDGSDCEPSEDGEIWVRGPWVIADEVDGSRSRHLGAKV